MVAIRPMQAVAIAVAQQPWLSTRRFSSIRPPPLYQRSTRVSPQHSQLRSPGVLHHTLVNGFRRRREQTATASSV